VLGSAPGACTGACTRAVTIGGDIITKKRNKLGVDNTRRLLCLQDWGVLAEKEVDNNSNQEDKDRTDS
jgi:hypothetical protein